MEPGVTILPAENKLEIVGDSRQPLLREGLLILRQLKGAEADFSACTFVLNDEDHTLGNALRWMIMKNPDVEFCGYSNPHPSEPKIHVRIQMYDSKSALGAMRQALDGLEQLYYSISEKFDENLAQGDWVAKAQDAPGFQGRDAATEVAEIMQRRRERGIVDA